MLTRIKSIPFLAMLSLMTSSTSFSQQGTSVYEGDWPSWAGSWNAGRYSPLDQITAENVNDLEIAWRWSTQGFGPGTDFVNPSTPLEVDGVLYANVGTTRNVVALDATSGQVLWMFRYDEGTRFDEAPRKGAGRGVAYYNNGEKARIFDISQDTNFVSLDPETGIPDPTFGRMA